MNVRSYLSAFLAASPLGQLDCYLLALYLEPFGPIASLT